MAERNQARTQHAREELRHLVGFSAADELEKLDRLKSSGSISEKERRAAGPLGPIADRALRPVWSRAF